MFCNVFDMTINPKFKIGDIVYSITDPDQYPRMVTGITIRSTTIYYLVTYIDNEKQFEDFELSSEKIYR